MSYLFVPLLYDRKYVLLTFYFTVLSCVFEFDTTSTICVSHSNEQLKLWQQTYSEYRRHSEVGDIKAIIKL